MIVSEDRLNLSEHSPPKEIPSEVSNHLLFDSYQIADPCFPRVDLRIQRVLLDQKKIREWVQCFGSPLNVIFPEIARENGNRWLAKLRKIHPATSIRFGMKVCRSDSLTAGLAMAGIGMDVSSAQEMIAAFNALVPSSKITFTGPDKPDHDLSMCLVHGIPVNVDSLGEADRIIELSRSMQVKGRAVLRLLPSIQPESRFGLNEQEIIEAAQKLDAAGIAVTGLSFHLSGYNSAERVRIAGEALMLAKKLADSGIIINSLSIGGGFTLSYLERDVSPDTLEALSTWRGVNKPSNYPYFTQFNAEKQAGEILCAILDDPVNRKIINSLNLEILLEPGRAMTDQCGGTIFRVTGTKKMETGQYLVILDGTSFSMSENWFGSDFIPLPIHLAISGGAGVADCVLVGRSCLESDVVRWRFVRFSSLPQPGDLIYIHNTTGYQMDMSESAFHRIPLPRKIAVFVTGGAPKVQLDSEVNIASWITP